ncbi:hypothetical protein [Clostridium sp. SM-530-WT-3G]|uniref:restriction endonuclease-related protein n=1 Tax=Clostridium sp. SM-530-WT-3G TaxID=2725303 RepID=UPI001FAC7A18|nr:hypothetical protein [Clostridium sp. SM-530-WT-3G]
MNDQFVKEFEDAVYLGVMGVYKRLKCEEYITIEKDDKFIKTLTKATSIFSFMNYKYNLYDNSGKEILPTDESKLFNMFQNPLEDIIESLPENFRKMLEAKSNLLGLEPLIELNDTYSCILTEEGFEFLNSKIINDAKDEYNQETEYKGQRIYLELIKGTQEDYNECRNFLMNPDNVILSDNKLSQTPKQKEFIKAYSEIVRLCYDSQERKTLYRCPECGMILREYKKGVFSCVSKRCNKNNFENKYEAELPDGTFRVLNEVAAHNIYYPGQLEIQIKNIIDKYEVKYEVWPEKDTWDFKIIFENDEVWFIDAKDIEAPHWIIEDIKTKKNIKEKIIYIVPNDKHKNYLRIINEQIPKGCDISCMKLKDFEEILLFRIEGSENI